MLIVGHQHRLRLFGDGGEFAVVGVGDEGVLVHRQVVLDLIARVEEVGERLPGDWGNFFQLNPRLFARLPVPHEPQASLARPGDELRAAAALVEGRGDEDVGVEDDFVGHWRDYGPD